MQAFEGRTVAITGAASGIGSGLAREASRRGMSLVLADVDEGALSALAQGLRHSGVRVLDLSCDVTRADEVERLAVAAEREFGGADLVFNNAGVTLERPLWEYTQNDWQWVLGVNLWGTIHGVRSFVPRMLARGRGHIVNVSSVAGLTPLTGLGAYNVAKHAVVALSETLHHDLRARNAPVYCSLLCPGRVETAIESGQRNRPAHWTDADGTVPQEPHRFSPAGATAAMSPDQVARFTFDAVSERRFYILTHPRVKTSVEARAADIASERDPRDPYSL